MEVAAIMRVMRSVRGVKDGHLRKSQKQKQREKKTQGSDTRLTTLKFKITEGREKQKRKK